ncbi:unnamed protein product [Ceutorhynchus assimilis]|uniref:Ubiquitin-like modifier-activating enzyme ATG7 n=1 Tax=Ceutorhynchus assimilis TaxID=467358 RepID=A0A9N9MG56_9CUCU|nr:unnamed protein product [Ceutorhynchus assimilis]
MEWELKRFVDSILRCRQYDLDNIGRNMRPRLKYVSPSSVVNPSFWNKLTELKLDVDRLEETERPLWGYMHFINNDNLPTTFVEVDSTSFNDEFNSQNIYIPLYGKIANKNTIEQFRQCNKLTFLQREGAQLFEKIVSGEALDEPGVLNCFVILAYADLKKYSYRFWFAFPVLNKVFIERLQTHRISNEFTKDERLLILNEFMKLDNMQKPYFLVDTRITSRKKQLSVRPIADIINISWRMWTYIYFGFLNISSNKNTVGSQLRNFVALIGYYCPYLEETNQKFLALRCKRETEGPEGSQISIEHSSVHTLRIPWVSEHDRRSCTGWEKNFQDKLGPKLANMRNLLDPLKLAEGSVDLNLKLMKWRAVPDIDLEKIKDTKCLLLGSGTLGCSVARSLLAWGVRYITLVDSATVSFSNPVRQSLFTYEDSVKMRIKSEAAAERLRDIFPGVISKGVHLTIPMPGHSVGPDLVPQVTDNIERLIDLIKCADIIFLLMDSRESRWLPAMLGNFFGKTVINAAVGFDSYLVMRHGYKNEAAGAPSTSEVNGYRIIQGHNLGCYFCNDVRAPGDTMSNRTLDQQCTVSRPGVAQIASALAVELAVSILQHKEGHNAPAFYKMSNQGDERNPEAENPGLLGLVPHSIRGFLSHYEQIIPATLKYNQCVACSDFVLEEYRNRGMEFLFLVFNSSKHLEDVTKLTDMFSQLNPDDVLVELDDETSD